MIVMDSFIFLKRFVGLFSRNFEVFLVFLQRMNKTMIMIINSNNSNNNNSNPPAKITKAAIITALIFVEIFIPW